MAHIEDKIPGGPRMPARRDLLKLPLMAAAYGIAPSSAFGLAASRPAHPDEDTEEGTKIAVATSVRSTNEELLFLKQIGVRWVHASFEGGEGATPPASAADGAAGRGLSGSGVSYDEMRAARERFALYGIKFDSAIWNAGYRTLRIQLGQPGRDEDIDKFNEFLTNCGRLGIRTTHIDFHPGNTYTTNMITTPRGYTAREFSVDDFHKNVEIRMFDRDYSADDIWANYTYFLKAILPVAEKANVLLAHHPDDPPISPMNGVAKVFINYDGYKHAEDVAAGGNKYWGLCLCLGTWLEGGDTMGKDPAGMIQDFGARGKIRTFHFRNVSSPLPRFHETYQDDGYADMYQLMKEIRKVRSNASLIPDHYPGIVSDTNRRIDNAYMVGIMRQMLRRAYDEVG
jgi:mannonate dehydratase